MELALIIVAAALTFGVCYLVDKGYTKKFRSAPQHLSGLSVRLNRRYGVIGLALTVLGVAGMMAGLREGWFMVAGGGFLVATGLAFVAYYISWGIYYDEDTFLVCGFGRKSRTYYYRDIQSQGLFNASGNIVIELYMKDGSAVQLQAAMEGAYAFMDKAFSAWCRQKGIREETCDFHNSQQCRWFPAAEE